MAGLEKRIAKLEQMATTDGLTGLLNKRAMLDAATQKMLARAEAIHEVTKRLHSGGRSWTMASHVARS